MKDSLILFCVLNPLNSAIATIRNIFKSSTQIFEFQQAHSREESMIDWCPAACHVNIIWTTQGLKASILFTLTWKSDPLNTVRQAPCTGLCRQSIDLVSEAHWFRNMKERPQEPMAGECWLCLASGAPRQGFYRQGWMAWTRTPTESVAELGFQPRSYRNVSNVSYRLSKMQWRLWNALQQKSGKYKQLQWRR